MHFFVYFTKKVFYNILCKRGKGLLTSERNKQMKLYRVIIYKNGKEQTRATAPDLELLKKWAKDCQKEDTNITYEIYEEV